MARQSPPHPPLTPPPFDFRLYAPFILNLPKASTLDAFTFSYDAPDLPLTPPGK